MTNTTLQQSSPARSLGISLSQGFDVLEPSHPVFLALRQLNCSFDLSQVQLILFLRGRAISFLQSSDRLSQLIQSMGGHAVTLYCCSTAFEEMKEEGFQADPNLEFEIAGLGFWAEFIASNPGVDFSCSNMLPEFVMISAHPDNSTFVEQLDLALAAAAFDMEPALFLCDEASNVLSEHYQNSSSRKKLNAAELYGVSQILSFNESKSTLLELCAHKKQDFRLSCIHISKMEKLGLPEVSDFQSETLLQKDRILVL